jgi:hypothetical protein
MTAQIPVDGVEQRVQAQRLAALTQEGAAGGGARGVTRQVLGAKALEAACNTGILRLDTAA